MIPANGEWAAELDEVLELLARAGGPDLRDYARPPLRERAREWASSMGVAEPREWASRLRGDREALRRLGDALLVRATSLFRDPEVFHELGASVVPALAASLAPGLPLRAWSIGCASGEEAWSLGALLAERLPPGRPFDVLGTDLDADALETAGSPTFDPAALQAVPLSLRRAFQLRPDGRIEPAPALRQRVRFAQHDLVGMRLAPHEAVVGWFELVACRNVLLYLEPRLRQKALGRLAAIVRPGGALILGLEEGSVLDLARAPFVPFPRTDPSLRIYARVG